MNITDFNNTRLIEIVEEQKILNKLNNFYYNNPECAEYVNIERFNFVRAKNKLQKEGEIIVQNSIIMGKKCTFENNSKYSRHASKTGTISSKTSRVDGKVELWIIYDTTPRESDGYIEQHLVELEDIML